MEDEKQKLRAAIAQEHGFALYRQYGEEQVAHYLAIDVSTLKRWRRDGKVSYVPYGDRGVRYMGYHIADLLADGPGPGRKKGGPLNGGGNIIKKALDDE